jgi:hypothetical protein
VLSTRTVLPGVLGMLQRCHRHTVLERNIAFSWCEGEIWCCLEEHPAKRGERKIER